MRFVAEFDVLRYGSSLMHDMRNASGLPVCILRNYRNAIVLTL